MKQRCHNCYNWKTRIIWKGISNSCWFFVFKIGAIILFWVAVRKEGLKCFPKDNKNCFLNYFFQRISLSINEDFLSYISFKGTIPTVNRDLSIKFFRRPSQLYFGFLKGKGILNCIFLVHVFTTINRTLLQYIFKGPSQL